MTYQEAFQLWLDYGLVALILLGIIGCAIGITWLLINKTGLFK